MLSVLLWPFLVLDPFICTATQVHVLDTCMQRHTITMNRKVHIPHALSSRIPPLHSQISSTTTASPLKLSSSLCQCLLKIHCNSLSPLSPSLLSLPSQSFSASYLQAFSFSSISSGSKLILKMFLSIKKCSYDCFKNARCIWLAKHKHKLLIGATGKRLRVKSGLKSSTVLWSKKVF